MDHILFTIALLVGIGLGVGLLALSRRHPSLGWPHWTVLAIGAAAVLLFVAGVLGLMDTNVAVIPSLALPFAGLVFGIGRVVRGDRCWQSWLGLALAAVPGLFWIAFAIAELVMPHQ